MYVIVIYLKRNRSIHSRYGWKNMKMNWTYIHVLISAHTLRICDVFLFLMKLQFLVAVDDSTLFIRFSPILRYSCHECLCANSGKNQIYQMSTTYSNAPSMRHSKFLSKICPSKFTRGRSIVLVIEQPLTRIG